MKIHMVDGFKALVAVTALVLGSTAFAGSEPSSTLSPEDRAKVEKRMSELTKELGDLGRKLGDDRRVQVFDLNRVAMNRAMLGINVDNDESSNKGDGVHIAAVTPKGPAASAGLRAGDVLTSIDGKALKKDGDQTPYDKLRAQMEGKEPGDEVKLKVLRDGKPQDFTVKAEAYAPRSFSYSFGGPNGLDDLTQLMPRGPMPPMMPMAALPPGGSMGPGIERFRWFTRQWGDLEMVSLSPKLGEYFGAKDGVLVVHAPADGAIKLQDGDVIVKVGERKPADPEQVLRILRSYDAGDPLKLEVLRNRKSITIDTKVPDPRDRGHDDGETVEIQITPP